MKKLLRFTVGFIGAGFIYFAFAYGFGLLAESMGIRLYESEADQQRNFNIVVALWLVISVTAGLYLAKKTSS